MKITVFTENPADEHGRMVSYEPTWYIRTNHYRILFVAGRSDSFWKYAGKMGINVQSIDMIVLPQGCKDPIRELERFLIHNQNAKIYLPRMTYEKHFFELCNKMMMYSPSDRMTKWLDRIVFMDETMQIDMGVHIFTGKVQEMYQTPQGQSMILSEEGKTVLFANNEEETADHIQEKAKHLFGGDINYLFYHAEQGGCIEKDCRTRKTNSFRMGEAVIV